MVLDLLGVEDELIPADRTRSRVRDCSSGVVVVVGTALLAWGVTRGGNSGGDDRDVARGHLPADQTETPHRYMRRDGP